MVAWLLIMIKIRISSRLFRLHYQSEVAFFTAKGTTALLKGTAHLVILLFSCIFPQGNIYLAFLTPLYARGTLLLAIAHLAVAVADVVVTETPHVRV